MSTQTDLARLQSELDDPFTPLLLALADWHEENDLPALARAYRRIASEGKVPDIMSNGWLWHSGDAVGSVPYTVGPDAWERLKKAKTYSTLSQAYHALALAYADLEKESTSG